MCEWRTAGVGATVKQLAGGCMCCALAGPMTAAVAQLVRQSRPARLLIEASGLGHPAGLVDVLQQQHFQTSLRLEAIVCLVDPCQVRHESLWLLDMA
jgi:G3E family GTPase